MKTQGKLIGKTCQSLLAPSILFIYRIWSTPSVFHGQWEIFGVCLLLSRWRDNFGAASSSQTDIYKESEVFTAAMAAGALDSWESRTGDVCCLSHRITCRRKSIRQLQSPLLVLWHSQHFLRPKKIKNRWVETFPAAFIPVNPTAQWLTFFFFFFWVLRLAELWSKFFKGGEKDLLTSEQDIMAQEKQSQQSARYIGLITLVL